ncbi:MAG: HTTM domain-containing protein, partial [Acidobacteriales bacterium]|nr:HTTM domain-containing protein [Terriglobales bacterium]
MALGLLVGYRTRLLAVLNFLLVLSVHERNVYVLTGADTAMRVLSFWMMFIPLGDYYSMDSFRCPKDYRSAFAFPVRLIQFQVALIYLVAGLLKLSGEAWQNGEALFYVLQLEGIQWPPGAWLRQTASQGLLRLFT